MNFWLFLQDRWRTVLFFCVGLILGLATLWIYSSLQDVFIPLSIVLYALSFGVISLIVAVLWDYVRQKPFYTELKQRVLGEGELVAASTFTQAETNEQTQYLQMLHKYHHEYMKTLNELEENRQFYQMFVTRFAHQMKTPITVIQLIEEELAQLHVEKKDEEKHTRLIESIVEERNRLTQAINMMLYTARLDAFSFDASMEKVDIVALLRHEINQHKLEWIRYTLYPKLDIPEAEVYVYSDRKWLAFICEQIIRNAIQYGLRREQTDRGATPFHIHVLKSDELIEVQFIDQGIGIPAEDLRRIFEPFYTGANGRTHSRATGMGLYLVKEVVNRLGHRIKIESTEGVGTTVKLQLLQPQYHNEVLPTKQT